MKSKLYKAFMSTLVTLTMILSLMGCGTTNKVPESQIATETVEKVTVLGEGTTKFLFTVADKDGNEEVFEIHTDKETVGEALMELELLAGEEGAYGLYVKTVNGITADYNVDQTYWAFYIDGEYAMSGVDMTPVEDGKAYALKVEK